VILEERPTLRRWIDVKECQNLDEVRAGIDALDRRIVELLSERSGYIEQAAKIKNSAAEIEVPARVEEIVHNVRGLATEYGMSPDIAEDIYRVMVARFIEFEMQRYRETLP
jgi:isochorismate pyruvate lyase